jgi:quercetin dioxygenase-like cupin family protein
MAIRRLQNASRRTFLRTAPFAAAAGLSLADSALLAEALQPAPAKTATFQYFTADALASEANTLMSAPGNKNLVTDAAFAVVMTTEVRKSAKEFEWHEGRDHIVQILDGSTVYEVGGTPKDARKTKPGEYLAPDSVGATKLTMKKGDMLTIPRGTPHKRSTEGSVTFILISPAGMPQA